MKFKYTIKILSLLGLILGSEPALAANNPSDIQAVSTVAELQAKGPASFQYPTVQVKGYATENDGGGGLFYWIQGSLPCDPVTGGGDSGTTFCAKQGSNYITTGYWKRQFSTPLNPLWFGALGNSNGTTGHDDTSAIQNTFSAAAHYQSGVYFPVTNGCYLITGPLTFNSFGPIDMATNGSSICATGTGYTALTVTPGRNFQAIWNVYLYGPGGFINTGNTQPLDGFVWNSPQGVVGGQIRVRGFYGRCLYINDMYDSHFDSISTEDCGNDNANEFAFNLAAVSNTTNQSSISRLQVEKAYCQAINVDPTNINILIENIHSEQARDCSGLTTYNLGGSRSTYVNARIESSAYAPSILFYGANTSFINMFLGSTVTSQIRPLGSGDTCWLQFIGEIGGNFTGYSNNTCIAMFDQGHITSLNTNVLQVVATGTSFTSLSVDNHSYLTEYENGVRCYGCKIGTLSTAGTTTTSGIRLVNSVVSAATTIPNRTWIEGTEIDGNVSIGSTTNLQMDANSYVSGNLTYAAGIMKIRNSRVGGNLVYSSGSNLWSFVNAQITGTVSANFGSAPTTSSQFNTGEISDNLIYTSGQPMGWQYFGSTTGWKPLAAYP